VTNNRADRHDRLRNALRENLKRRKAQIKGRAAAVDSPADKASIDRDETARADEVADPKRSP
jgi:hypothetical protein